MVAFEEMAERLLLALARYRLDGWAREDVEELVRGVDWQHVLNVAGIQRLSPLLRSRLLELDMACMPPSIRDHLQLVYYKNLLHNEMLQKTLQDIVGALREQGVETIVLKGGALARTIYPHLALRPMDDLDLLIRREDMDQVLPILDRLEYRPFKTTLARSGDFPWFYGGEVMFVRETQEGYLMPLDFHWHIVTVGWYRYTSTIDMEALWRAARPLALDGLLTWQLSLEDTLIHLCLHMGIQHGYECPLIHYVDIDRLAHDRNLQWDLVVQRSTDFQVKAAVYWGLSLVRRSLGTEIPPFVLQALRPAAHRRWIVQHLVPRHALPRIGSVSVVRNRLLRLSLMDRSRDAAKMVRQTLFPAREWLVARYGLGSRTTVCLYRIRHPLLVVWRLLRAVLRNAPVGIFYVREPQSRGIYSTSR